MTESNVSARPYIKFFLFYGLLNMAISVMWGAYNNYFPIILQAGNPNFTSAGAVQVAGFGLSALATGLIMSIDNFFAVFFLPIFGAWGDKTIRRREMGIILGFICAGAYLLLPVLTGLVSPEQSGNTGELMPLLIVTVILVFVTMFTDAVGAQFRSGYQFFMVPKIHQSKMSSFSVLFGGIGFLFATFVGSMLYVINKGIPFYIGGGVMFLVIIGFALLSPPETEKNERILAARAAGTEGKFNPFKTIAETYQLLPKVARLSILFIFLAKILSSFGLYGMQTYASSYMYVNLNFAPNIAMIVTGVYFLGYMLMAVPIGIIADRINKAILLAIGCACLMIGALGFLFIARDFITTSACALFVGAAASVMDVITIPYIMSFAPKGGTNTGTLYSTTVTITVCVSLVAVPILGFIIDFSGQYSSLFWTMLITTAVALGPCYKLWKLSKNTPVTTDTGI